MIRPQWIVGEWSHQCLVHPPVWRSYGRWSSMNSVLYRKWTLPSTSAWTQVQQLTWAPAHLTYHHSAGVWPHVLCLALAELQSAADVSESSSASLPALASEGSHSPSDRSQVTGRISRMSWRETLLQDSTPSRGTKCCSTVELADTLVELTAKSQHSDRCSGKYCAFVRETCICCVDLTLSNPCSLSC